MRASYGGEPLSRRLAGGMGLLLLAIAVAWCYQALTAPEPGKPVVVQQSRTYTLGELAALVRNETASNLVVHRDHQQRRLFVSQGTYDVGELLDALRAATRLSSRKVGDTLMLAPISSSMTAGLEYPMLPRSLQDRTRAMARRHAADVDLRSEGIPFDAADFLSSKTAGFADLSEEQRAFLVARFRRNPSETPYFAVVPPPLPVLEASDIEKELAGAELRLGTTLQMFLITYHPGQGDQSGFDPTWMTVVPLFDDVRDRLDIELPDE